LEGGFIASAASIVEDRPDSFGSGDDKAHDDGVACCSWFEGSDSGRGHSRALDVFAGGLCRSESDRGGI
jgi:hypothetical protein